MIPEDFMTLFRLISDNNQQNKLMMITEVNIVVRDHHGKEWLRVMISLNSESPV